MCYNKSALKSLVAQILFSRRHLKETEDVFDYTRSLTEGVLEAGAPSGSRGCRVERQLVFHHCGPGSNPG